MAKTVQFAKSGEINPEKVKNAVYNRIDFELPEWLWVKIDTAFATCWNNEIGLRGWVHENQIETAISKKLKQENIMFDYDKINRIVKIMYEYIEMTGGFLD